MRLWKEIHGQSKAVLLCFQYFLNHVKKNLIYMDWKTNTVIWIWPHVIIRCAVHLGALLALCILATTCKEMRKQISIKLYYYEKFPKRKFTFNMQIVCDIVNTENDFISFPRLHFLYYDMRHIYARKRSK